VETDIYRIYYRISTKVWISFLCWTQNKIFWWIWVKNNCWWAPLTSIVFLFPYHGSQWGPSMVLATHILQKYLLLCSAEETNSYRFGTTWSWVSADKIVLFGRAIPLMHLWVLISKKKTYLTLTKPCEQYDGYGYGKKRLKNVYIEMTLDRGFICQTIRKINGKFCFSAINTNCIEYKLIFHCHLYQKVPSYNGCVSDLAHSQQMDCIPLKLTFQPFCICLLRLRVSCTISHA